ncbi:hypothetical protein J3459_003901 [Metarhizium acridum]|uniref:uncharacterized protein n=1 Tax=Metarhizium acridum TaxID=92637 RepID=UPI001C6CFC3B|nr:hypothetical protein J3458_002816 [Metarhizium acridum]KAG8428479.1 hypothetical protein J3459_003901 [Metarhizium acridum]
MKYFTILAVLSVLAAANPLFSRQEADNAHQLVTFRVNFCVDASELECQEAKTKCQDESKIIRDCIRDERPACIEDEASPCSVAVSQCLRDFGETENADQAFEDCIAHKVIPSSAANGDDEAGTEQAAAPGSRASPEQVAACAKAGAEYEVALFKNNCDEINSDVGDAAPEGESPACKSAGAAFEQAWTANNCEAAFGVKE